MRGGRKRGKSWSKLEREEQKSKDEENRMFVLAFFANVNYRDINRKKDNVIVQCVVFFFFCYIQKGKDRA